MKSPDIGMMGGVVTLGPVRPDRLHLSRPSAWDDVARVPLTVRVCERHSCHQAIMGQAKLKVKSQLSVEPPTIKRIYTMFTF